VENPNFLLAEFGGDSVALTAAPTSMCMLKRMVDGLNHSGIIPVTLLSRQTYRGASFLCTTSSLFAKA